MITVNGNEISLTLPMTLSEYLEQNQYKLSRIAVELNGNIIPKSEYASVSLNDGDHLEVVSFVGGG